MRVTGGSLSGRALSAPEGMATRPTSDRVRAALFNILMHHDFEIGRDPIHDAFVLDAFSGTGALAIECLSRGSGDACLFENDRKAALCIKGNLKTTGLASKAHLLVQDVTHPPEAKQACSLIFFDPPYKKGLIPVAYEALKKKGWIASNALIVAETSKKEEVLWPATLAPLLARDYGDTTLHFLKEIS